MTRNLLIAAAVGGGLYLFATRTCRGRALVAKLRGIAPTDCGCGCTDHPASEVEGVATSSNAPPGGIVGLESGAGDIVVTVPASSAPVSGAPSYAPASSGALAASSTSSSSDCYAMRGGCDAIEQPQQLALAAPTEPAPAPSGIDTTNAYERTRTEDSTTRWGDQTAATKSQPVAGIWSPGVIL